MKKKGSVNNQIFKVYSEACLNGVSFDTVLRSLSGTFGRGSRSEKSIQPCTTNDRLQRDKLFVYKGRGRDLEFTVV